MLARLLDFLGFRPARRAAAPESVAAPRPETPAPRATVPEGHTGQTEALLAHTLVLDRDQRAAGYLVSLREQLAGHVRAPGRQARDFLDLLKVESLLRDGHSLLGTRAVYLPVWDGFLPHAALDRLQGAGVVLVLQAEAPDAAPPDATLARVSALRAAGLRIALEDRIGTPWFEAFAALADFFTLDSSQRPPGELRRLGEQLQLAYPATGWLAWNVATQDDFGVMHRLGCDGFQGGFVTHRGDWQGNRVQPRSLAVARVMNRLNDDVETRDLAAVLKHDMALTYRLLRYVNAAAWGINNPITSVEQALIVLGRQPLRRWLALLLFAGARSGAGSALIETALARARFMELLGAPRMSREECEQLFVLGLFSLLDVVMQVPLAEALAPLNLSEAVTDALLTRRGPLQPYLTLTEASERGDSAAMFAAREVLGVAAGEINARQFEALSWVHALEEGPAAPRPASLQSA
jgi:EAL and modified HD-GYP domain-containing signal transduction protein